MIRRDSLDWLEEAKEELKTAEELFKLARYAHSCFHAQQAAEKAFKAVILYVKKVFNRSHDLVELYKEVEKSLTLNNLLKDMLAELSAYYTQSRYPNAGLRRPSIEIGKEQAKRCLNVAKGVVNEANKFFTS